MNLLFNIHFNFVIFGYKIIEFTFFRYFLISILIKFANLIKILNCFLTIQILLSFYSQVLIFSLYLIFLLYRYYLLHVQFFLYSLLSSINTIVINKLKLFINTSL